MKKITLALTCAAVTILSGCGQKPSDNTATPGTTTESSAVSKELQQAATKVATEAATEVKKQAQEVFANLGQQLVEATKGGNSDALLKNISADLEARVGKLTQSLAANETVKQQLNTSVQALLGNKDADAVAALNKLAGAKLTPEQTALAKDVYNAGAAFVTQRNFSAIEGMNSDVAQLVNSVWKGNYTQALTPLQKLYSKSTLTAAQKDLLTATFDPYMPAGWKDAAGAVKQGAETLKKFGL